MLDEHFAPYKIDEKTLVIPCFINPSSMMGGDAGAYVMLCEIYEPESRVECGLGVAWVLPETVTILEQPFLNDKGEFKAKLAIRLIEERPDRWTAAITSRGVEHILKIPKPVEVFAA